MTNQADFHALLKAVSHFKLPGQTDSQGLLHWFLFNVFRLDDIESRDALCDGPNDKGIDAVWVDQDSEEIFLFQSVYTDRIANNLGDSELRKFVGSATRFSNPENLQRLQAGQTNPELKALVARFDLGKRLEDGYEVKLVFASTRMLDGNGKEYLESLDSTGWKLDVWDRLRLVGQHKNLERRTRVAGTHTFVTRSKGFDYEPEQGVRVHVRPVRASDIASMNGIADRGLFSLNVRSGLGRTRVNRDLERAVRETSKHNQIRLIP